MKQRSNHRTPLTLLVLALLAAPVLGQGPAFVPIPPEVAPRYHFNFPRNFFAAPEEEKSQRKTLYSGLAELERLKGKVTATAENLYRALTLGDAVESRFMRHYIYLYLRYAVNTKEEQSYEEFTRLGAEFNRRTSFLQQEIMRLDPRVQARFAAQQPALKPLAFAIRSARRARRYTLSLKEEELLSATAPLTGEWQGELYQKVVDRTEFGKVRAPEGDLDVRKQSGALDNSADRPAREQGFRKRYAGYATARDLYAFSLTRLVKSMDDIARLRHYRDYPHQAHFGLYLNTPEVKALFESIAGQAEFNKRYQRLRADRIRKIAGYSDVNVWDLTVVPPGMRRPRFTIGEASRTLEEVLAPLGSEYRRELDALLNPEHGRLDLVPGDHRVPGAFAWGFPGSQVSIFYSYNYEGFYDDVSTLAHEAGHAVHFQLMGNNHVLPTYVDGPIYFTEAFAMLNELLLADHLYRGESDLERKTFFLEQFLRQAMGLFAITRQAALEQAIYDGIQAGKIKTADDLDTLAKQHGSRFSVWFEKHDELKMEWIEIHHFFRSPMYYVNYVYANLLALKFFEELSRERSTFVPRYVALMRNGFNEAPSTLLKKFLNVELRDPNLVPGALSVLDGKIRELESLYARR